MGCCGSKIGDAEDVARCKARKQFIRQSVSARHAFAAAHTAYGQALKNMGAALRQFTETEVWDPSPKPLRPPPPLPPEFLHSPSPLLQETLTRSLSLPAFMLQKQRTSPNQSTRKPTFPQSSIVVEMEQEQEKVDEEVATRSDLPAAAPTSSSPPPASNHSGCDYLNLFPVDALHLQEHKQMQTLETVGEQLMCNHEEEEAESQEGQDQESSEVEESESLANEQQQEREDSEEEEYSCEGLDEGQQASLVIEREQKNIKLVRSVPNKELSMIIPAAPKTGWDPVDAIRRVDDAFLKAYDCGKDVARMLEARKIHYHSNFVDSKGFYDHSSKVLSAITWGHWHNNSKTLLASGKGTDKTEGLELQVSHASILDRLFAWERKLYDEVKGIENIRLKYERKCAELRQRESKGIEAEELEGMKASIKSLRTRIMVALQAVNTATFAIAKLRDDELYMQLLNLLHESMNMWQEMYENHQEQRRVLLKIKNLDMLRVDATSSVHMLATQQLEGALNTWHYTFNKLIATQREYMQNLIGWLRLNLIPLETTSGEKLDHQTDLPTPPIYELCQEWHEALEKLPDKLVMEAIINIVSVVHTMVQLHAEELQHRKRAETLSRELDKKVTALQNYKRKYLEPAALVEGKQDLARSPLHDKKAAIDVLWKKLDDEKAKIAKAIQGSRMITVDIFCSGLPKLFEEITRFSSICSQAYHRLYKHLTISESPAGGVGLIAGIL